MVENNSKEDDNGSLLKNSLLFVISSILALFFIIFSTYFMNMLVGLFLAIVWLTGIVVVMCIGILLLLEYFD